MFEGIGCIFGLFIFFLMLGIILVEFVSGEENEMLILKNVFIVIGFCLNLLLGLELDGEYVMFLDYVLKMEMFFSLIIIVGGGVIGIEWVFMFVDFGVEVIVLEYVKMILLLED